MDVPLAGTVLLLGASLGSSIFGYQSKPAPAPCVCHCDCISESSSTSGFNLGWWIFAGVLIGINLLLVALLIQARATIGQVDLTKGKGKKGVFGQQQALTVQ